MQKKLKSLEKIINFYTTRRDLINTNRSNRLKELELLKQKIKEILEDEKYFYHCFISPWFARKCPVLQGISGICEICIVAGILAK